MASRTFDTVKSTRRGATILSGTVTFGSTGAVSSYSTGTGFTLTRTGTGAYTVTLSDAYHSLVACSLGVVNASQEDGHWQRVGELTSGRTFTILHASSTAASDPGSGTKLDLMVVVKNSGVYP